MKNRPTQGTNNNVNKRVSAEDCISFDREKRKRLGANHKQQKLRRNLTHPLGKGKTFF